MGLASVLATELALGLELALALEPVLELASARALVWRSR